MHEFIVYFVGIIRDVLILGLFVAIAALFLFILFASIGALLAARAEER